MDKPADKAREQMRSMGLSAPYIGSKETRTEEEVAADRQTLAEVAPGTGDVLAIKNYPKDMSIAKEIISQGLDKGELSSVLGGIAYGGLSTIGLLPSITGVGAGAKVAKKTVKENLKKNLVKKFGDDGASKVVDTVGEASQPIKITGVKPPKKTVKAYKLFKKDKNGNLYPLFVKMQGNKPLKLNTWTKAEAGEVNTKTGKVKSSLGDLAYRPGFHGGDLPIATHIGGKKGKVSKPNYRKDNQVWAEVEFGDDTDWQSIANSRALVNKDGTTRVSTAHITDQIPEGGFYRYKTNPNMTGNWLIGGELKINRILDNDEVKSINDAAGVADLPRLSELNMAEGGVVPMNNMAKQMEMFDDGGLMDEGGTVDPVSGNDVPPGSNQEEVRDDIPAQLSEGEFVFPADVVRFIGLEKLMKIRQRAKAGLQRMEDMGQMGNSEEAIMPDDLPFSIEDLDMEDDGLEMAQGGVVHMANGGAIVGGGIVPAPPGIFGTNPNPNPQGLPTTPTTGVAAAPMQAASSGIGQAATPVQAGSGQPTMFTNYQLPQAPVPVMTPPAQLPKFLGGVTPGVGGIDYVEEIYVNESGQTIKFRRYNDGTLRDAQGNIAVIPEGYTIKADADKKVTTDPTKVKTATVQDEGNDTFEEDQAKMKQDQARVDAAKALGYTKFAGFTQGLGSALGFSNLPEGTVTGIGYIADGLGNIIDPTSGLMYPEGLLDGIKDINNKVYDTLRHGTFDKGTRDIIAKGVGASDKDYQTSFLKEVRQKMAGKEIKDKFKDIRDDIKDGKFTSDFATSKEFEKYVDTVEAAMKEEVKNQNIDFQTGRVINPFEASDGRNRGDGRFDDEPPSAQAPASSVFGTDYSGPPQDEGPGDTSNNDGPQGDEASGGSVSGDMSDDSDG